MSTEVYRVLVYMVGGVAILAILLLLDLVLSGLANRFVGRPGQYGQRIGTQLPRLRR